MRFDNWSKKWKDSKKKKIEDGRRIIFIAIIFNHFLDSKMWHGAKNNIEMAKRRATQFYGISVVSPF